MTERAQILLLGGTSETASLALRLAELGWQVLVSTATDEPLNSGQHSAISRRSGRLNRSELIELITVQGFSALVDATHPYAEVVHRNARNACEETGCPYLRYQRQETQGPRDAWLYADDHEQASLLACESGLPILLTIGSRHLAPYVEQASRRQLPLYARVLNHPDSVAACNAAGLETSRRIFGRGPFSYEDNLTLIRRYEIGVVVTKESGQVGGVEEKWRAAEHEHCQFIVVRRPVEPSGQSYNGINELLNALQQQCPQYVDAE